MCNCENAKCDHSYPCPRPAGKARVQWLGPVCDICASEYERLNPTYIRRHIDGSPGMGMEYKFPFEVRCQMVSKILAKHDPMKLLKIGAPDDEYDYEAECICLNLEKRTFGFNTLDVVNLCRQTFINAFSEMNFSWMEMFGWKEIAEEIINIHSKAES